VAGHPEFGTCVWTYGYSAIAWDGDGAGRRTRTVGFRAKEDP
jgi:hypothetical protein